MSIFKPAAPTPLSTYGFTATQLELLLNTGSATTFRQLRHVLAMPEDAPRLSYVLEAAVNAVAAYGATLASPSETFRLVLDSLRKLAADVALATSRVSNDLDLDKPLMRRLTAYGGYSLCMTLHTLTDDAFGIAHEVVGLEIALGLATGIKFDNGFATDVRRSLTPELFGNQKTLTKRGQDWQNTYIKRRTKAAKYFEASNGSDPESQGNVRLFDVAAGFELSRKMRFAPPRQRQALLDRRHQTVWQIKGSAAALHARAKAHDHTALLIMVAFSAGLSLRLTKDIPLANRVLDDAWFMVLDLDAGVIKISLDRLFPAAAAPAPTAECFRDANRIIVKPLPISLWLVLRELRNQQPNADTLSQLIPDAATSGRQLTLEDDDSAMVPSAKRFLISAAPFAVGIGIDRLAAAILTSDFAVIPSSKMYYCRVRRDEIWAASETLFAELGWGTPVPIVSGLAVGSRIVPRREALAAWWQWMVGEVAKNAPGRHCGLARLVQLHDIFAKMCASFAILCFAAREARELKFTTYNLQPDCDFIAYADKLVGIVPGEVKVPINAIFKAQLNLWHAHCRALHRRMEKLTGPAASRIRRMLGRYLEGGRYPLMFTIDAETGGTSALGSTEVMRWWPEQYRFSTDLGRHLWEVEFRDARVRSTRIDLFLRHLTLGTEAHCSTNMDKLADAAAELCAVQESLLASLGINAVPGLTK